MFLPKIFWQHKGDGHVEWFEGNFQAYEEDKLRRLGVSHSARKRVNAAHGRLKPFA